MNFRSFLNEASEQLDISIQAAGKYLTTDKKILNFLSSPVVIEHKTDGVKLTVIKKNDNDYIISYKGNVLYSEEYDYQTDVAVKKESIGASQFKAVFKHFSKLKPNNIPVGTELFIEFLMKKPTLSSNYSKIHKMVLIGHAKSTYVEKFGKLKTNPDGFNTNKRDMYAKQLKIDVPQKLFTGIMASVSQFDAGISNKILSTEFNKVKNSMNWNIPSLLVDDIRQLFLSIESKYGGLEEGVVIKTDGRLLKWQQEYQVDQSARALIKMKYREDEYDDETTYWNNVKSAAFELASSITVKKRNLKDVLTELSTDLKRYKLTFSHSKKTTPIIKDDIQLNAKTLIIKKLSGNNNALIIGKFRVLTKDGHVKLIKRAQKLYDNVVVCIVTSSANKYSKDIREKQLMNVFPDIEIIHAINGNVTRIVQKSSVNINVIYAGSDRVTEYQKQVKNSIGINIKEMPRTDSDISASEVIKELNDESFFKKSTPKEIHHLYDELKRIY